MVTRWNWGSADVSVQYDICCQWLLYGNLGSTKSLMLTANLNLFWLFKAFFCIRFGLAVKNCHIRKQKKGTRHDRRLGSADIEFQDSEETALVIQAAHVACIQFSLSKKNNKVKKAKWTGKICFEIHVIWVELQFCHSHGDWLEVWSWNPLKI